LIDCEEERTLEVGVFIFEGKELKESSFSTTSFLAGNSMVEKEEGSRFKPTLFILSLVYM
jgi:hypothetical protein